MTASEITGEEYETAWDRYAAANPGFAGYRTRTKRHLPIFILEDRAQVITATVGHGPQSQLSAAPFGVELFGEVQVYSRESGPQSSPLFAQTDPMRVRRLLSCVGGRSVGRRSPAVARQRSG